MFEKILRSWVRFGYRNNVTNMTLGLSDVQSSFPLNYYKWYLRTERVKAVLKLSK